MERVSTAKLQQLQSPISNLLNQVSEMEAELTKLMQRNQTIQQTKEQLFEKAIDLLARNKQVLARITTVNSGVEESLRGLQALEGEFVGHGASR